MSDQRSAVAAAIFKEGWTCTAHEPVGNWGDCPDCRKSLSNLADVVLSVALDAARDAVRHALGPMDPTDPSQHDVALAAIDALRGESNG